LNQRITPEILCSWLFLEGAWGRGRRLSVLGYLWRNPLLVFPVPIVHKKLHGCTRRVCKAFTLKFLGGSVAQRRVQSLPIVILLGELLDVRMQVIEITVGVGVISSRLSVFMELSQVALSYGSPDGSCSE